MSVIVAVAAMLAGACLHVFYFRKHEHHMYGIRYAQSFLAAFATLTSYLIWAHGEPALVAMSMIGKMYACGLTGLYTSLLLYRLFFHPLRHFPGPMLSRITSLAFSVSLLRSSDAHKKLLGLHRKHGAFVRIGSSDLSIAHPLGVAAVYSTGSACRKGSWYDEDLPRASIHTSRSHDFHARRRRLWSPAFGDGALRGYETRIAKYNAALVEKLKGMRGASVNASLWLNWWAFDVMGDIAFDKDFGMLEEGRQHWAIALLNDAMKLQGLHLPTWLFRMVLGIPGIAEGYWRFIGYCDAQVVERAKGEPSMPDVMSTLLPSLEKGEKDEMLTLLADARTIIIAGSDTTAATLVHCCYWLAKYPEHAEKIRDEIRGLEGEDGLVKDVKLQKAEYLNGVINETLRLNPVVPSIIQRKTPLDGIMVQETFVPGGMNVFCPQYVLARDESIYERAEDFVPGRWHSQHHMIKEKSAYAPFSTGVYGCIGKPLALLELRTVIATLLTSFDVVFAPGENGEGFTRDTKDQFTLCLADLHLCFVSRTK